MALYTTQKPSAAGQALTYGVVTSTDTFVNTGKEFLHVKTTSTGATVAIKCNNKCNFGVTNSAHDLSIALGTTVDAMIGPFDPTRFTDPATGLVTVTYTATTGITAAVISAS